MTESFTVLDEKILELYTKSCGDGDTAMSKTHYCTRMKNHSDRATQILSSLTGSHSRELCHSIPKQDLHWVDVHNSLVGDRQERTAERPWAPES